MEGTLRLPTRPRTAEQRDPYQQLCARHLRGRLPVVCREPLVARLVVPVRAEVLERGFAARAGKALPETSRRDADAREVQPIAAGEEVLLRHRVRHDPKLQLGGGRANMILERGEPGAAKHELPPRVRRNPP